ncbi:MAG: hypothetical protein AAGF26_17465, partial [Cyanobacteria bacterium P01_G01_bin.49]
LFGYYKETAQSPITLKPYLTLRNALSKPGEKEQALRKRWKFAESFIMQRAKEIDIETAEEFEKLGEDEAIAKGLQQLDLSNGIKTFFKQFSSEMFLYRSTGSDDIINAISSFLATPKPVDGSSSEVNGWLRENILIGRNPDDTYMLVPAGIVISSIFAESITPVTQMQINAKAAEDE